MCSALFSAAELADATGGVWQCSAEPDGLWSINTDSRTVRPGECFIPIAGERFDGHEFLDQLPEGVIALAEKGRKAPENLPVLEVKNTTKAYQAIARFHRQRFTNLTVTAVTGSVGKTSVKEMLRAIFTEAAGADAVLYTIGNTNNQIGVPQNLLRLTGSIKYAIIEMGTNHHGEIAPLSHTALPDAALINTIAACHLENLGDLNGVAKEKSAIFQAMKNPGGLAVYPSECAGLEIIRTAAQPFRQMMFGSGGAVKSNYIQGSLTGSEVELVFDNGNVKKRFTWQLTGEHQALNAAAAATLAYGLGIDPEIIAHGLSNTSLPGKRMNTVEFNNAVWINDAYNANPRSMQSSLECIAGNSGSKPLLLVLGDMLELGDEEIKYHRQVLEFVQKRFAGHNYTLFTLGKRFAAALKELDSVPEKWQNFDTLDSVQSAISRHRRDGMIIFLKSSNSTGLSKVEMC